MGFVGRIREKARLRRWGVGVCNYGHVGTRLSLASLKPSINNGGGDVGSWIKSKVGELWVLLYE